MVVRAAGADEIGAGTFVCDRDDTSDAGGPLRSGTARNFCTVECADSFDDELEEDDEDDGEPKFGRLLIFLMSAVIFCAVLTWVMGRYFPDFPNFI